LDAAHAGWALCRARPTVGVRAGLREAFVQSSEERLRRGGRLRSASRGARAATLRRTAGHARVELPAVVGGSPVGQHHATVSIGRALMGVAFAAHEPGDAGAGSGLLVAVRARVGARRRARAPGGARALDVEAVVENGEQALRDRRGVRVAFVRTRVGAARLIAQQELAAREADSGVLRGP